ncbi:VanZ family protein [Paenibacillus sp. LHD-38]|uniref:VanZ family protein n=1 Tax=Paenibacillus sp. LHD-38 TaxID=3072143 RepID=UPI0028107C6E|nr:VanZ family protein [Paenibacillus sp. LHD-38]MDQ8739294.1 VanZ family protein [Paenibacillus sp. LHD-38]
MNKSMSWLPTLLWGMLLAGWLSLLFMFSSQSYDEQSIQPFLLTHFNYHQLKSWLPDMTITYRTSVIQSQVDPFRFIEFLFRKGAHLFVYATLAALLFMFLRSLTRGRWFLSIIITLLIAIAVPAMDEWNQLGSNERTGNATDVVLDFAGGCAGLLVCLCILGIIKLLRRNRRSVKL